MSGSPRRKQRAWRTILIGLVEVVKGRQLKHTEVPGRRRVNTELCTPASCRP
ncbi:hypothetical protein BD310DRAFT_434937 [Dichomitus squalens]|uniref:Uncharacterized protein n=1 Tax=Dichomitus squalens TaxID=114155 RepID=A0A4Q9PWK8_9APHY|nr:hypothetical protein BD310DRAFT_434937 [Dichomitus squalens]